MSAHEALARRLSELDARIAFGEFCLLERRPSRARPAPTCSR